MDIGFNLWLIRIYAIIILIVAFADIFEGGTLKLILGIVSAAIIIQSFVIASKKVKNKILP